MSARRSASRECALCQEPEPELLESELLEPELLEPELLEPELLELEPWSRLQLER